MTLLGQRTYQEMDYINTISAQMTLLGQHTYQEMDYINTISAQMTLLGQHTYQEMDYIIRRTYCHWTLAACYTGK
jgi:hypothetical protein